MNATTRFSRAKAASILLLTLVVSAVAGQQRVTVYADEAPFATEQAMIYEAACPSGKYRFTFNYRDNRVEFEFDGANRNKVDLSTSSFGATFLEKALYGKFYSTCPNKDGIRLYFYGIEPKRGSTLKTVKLSVTFGNEGTIIHGGELVEEPHSSINYTFLSKLLQ